jgi:hypothetical protein
MPLISSATLLAIADRCAWQYNQIAVAFDNIAPTGTGSWGTDAEYYWQQITATDDPDVEIPTLNPYYTADYGINKSTAIKTGVPQLAVIVTTMDSHFSRMNSSGSWDGYLTAQDERVSDHFNQVYYLAKSAYMLSNNVFCENEVTMSTWAFGDVYTAGVSFGNGAATNRASGTNFAATQLKLVVGTASTSITDLTLVITGMTLGNPSPVVITAANISAGSPDDEFDVGTVADRFLSVTNVQADPAHAGSAGNVVLVKNIKERVVKP